VKVLIVGGAKIMHMPYLDLYLQEFRRSGCDIHLLYWNRSGGPDAPLPDGVTPHEIRRDQPNEVPPYRKIAGYARDRMDAARLLIHRQFDLVVVLTTIPALVLADILLRRYAGRFVLDYRDATYEYIWAYRQAVGLLVRKSLVTFISSDGFRELLPNMRSIITVHNLVTGALQHRQIRLNQPRHRETVRIRFWGGIRYEAVNRMIIDRLANDRRFEIHYHGSGEVCVSNLRNHCTKRGIRNVSFHGPYQPAERYQFIQHTDIINNVYGHDFNESLLVSNKFYDGIIHYLPQICSVGTHMGRLVTAYGLGKEVDPANDNFADELHRYYQEIEWDVFCRNCDTQLARTLREQELARQVLRQMCQGSFARAGYADS